MLTHCPNFNLIAHAELSLASHVLVRLRCKLWSCEYCSKENQSAWRAFLARKLPEISQTWYMVTLTAASWTTSEQSSYENLQNNLDRLMKRARRVWKNMQYVRVYEMHVVSERLHVHLLVSSLTPCVSVLTRHGKRICRPAAERASFRGYWSLDTWWKIAAQECRLGYMVDVQNVPVARAARYVTKYLTKDLQRITIKNLRHVQTSRAIGSPGEETGLIWTVGTFVTKHHLAAGQSLLDLTTKELVSSVYWNNHTVYPDDD